MRPRFDVAIHAPRGAPLYADPPLPPPGGAEVQMHYLATTLAARGLRVCQIVHDEPGLGERAQGVELIRMPVPRPRDGRLRQLRETFATLDRADARVYVQRNASSATGMVAAFARSKRRRFVLSTSWDGDLTLTAPIGGRAARGAYRLGRRMADVLVVQTRDQLEGAREVVPKPERLRLIRSFAEVAGAESGDPRSAFLWIGRIVDYKDPLAFVSLAERLPEPRFWMVADHSDPAGASLWATVRERAARLPNLELLEPLPRGELLDLYGRAAAVVSTSSVEGFPNTFMEAWSRGTPAISLRLDPDSIIRRHGLGFVAGGSEAELARIAARVWSERADPALGRRARAYIEAEHSPAVVGARWAALLGELGVGDQPTLATTTSS